MHGISSTWWRQPNVRALRKSCSNALRSSTKVKVRSDGSARIWDASTGEATALLSAMRERNDWVVVTPEGLFDGSEQGMQKLVAWRIGNRLYPPDRFFADFYTPGLLARIIAGERPRPEVDLATLKLPPEVRITSPTTGIRLQQEYAVVTVEVQDRGGGVAEVRLYQNGKLVGTRPGAPGTTSNYEFEAHLIPGENKLEVEALSKERVESNEDWVRVVFEAPELTKPALHLLVVGINQYKDPAFDLGFARPDAEAIARFFEQRGGRLFQSVSTIKLVDDAATKENIRQALRQLAREAQPEDVVIVYLAGHGVGLGQQFYFLAHEMRTEMDEEAAIRKYGLSAAALGQALYRIKALKQILILDACQSEAALTILAKAVMFRAGLGRAEQKAAKMLARSKGIYLIAASTKQQYAAEVPELGHGVLTYALLNGLGEKGKPQALVPGDGMVTAGSLISYVNQVVPVLTEQYHSGDEQYPVTHATGMDFPLVVQ